MDKIYAYARTNLFRLLALSLLLLLTACVGSNLASKDLSTGQMGPPGPQGLRGEAGPAGPEGPPGRSYVPPASSGLLVKITGVEIPEDQHPVVSVYITDENYTPIPIETLEGWGFTIAQIEGNEVTGLTRYQSLLVHDVEGKPYQLNEQTTQPKMEKASQAFADNSGTWQDLGRGVFAYTFANALSAPMNPNLATVIGLYAYRSNRTAVANDMYSFVKGATRQMSERQIVTNAACQQCHNPLQAHGGTRTLVTLCVTCHTDQTVDPETGNSLEFKVLVHRLHSGNQLPSVQAGTPYRIVGYRQNVFDFSNGTWTQDVRNCTTCHSGAPESSNYKTRANIEACTSCHDTTNFATGENHPGGQQANGQCEACHEADGDEFDSSITGAHTIPTNAKFVSGIKLEILSVEGMRPGGSPVVKFRMTNNADQPLDPEIVASLSITLAGPTSDYQNRWTEPVISAQDKSLPALIPDPDGSYQYAFKAQVPGDAIGTFAVGMEGYVMEPVVPGRDPVRIAARNPVFYVSLDGKEAAARRQVVDIKNCNACHENLSAHGTIRNNLEYCVLCHNGNATDETRRPPEAMPPTTINFPLLIHKLHRGEEANQPLQVYGYGNKLNDFGEVIFPGDLSACQTCHLPNSYGLPLATGIHPTNTTQEGQVVSTVLPVRAVCTSCHDDPDTAAHAELQTSQSGVESCTVCHGAGREFDVVRSHK